MLGRWTICAVLGLAVSGCGVLPQWTRAPAPEFTDATPPEGTIRPRARAEGGPPVPPKQARTEEQFDTTSAAERQAALAAPAQGGERALGRTVASLGDPSQPGFWIKTALVQSEGPGRVVYPVNGRSVQVTLIPLEGAPTAGSRLSLAAFRLLEAPLTGLPEIDVYSGG